MSYKQAQKAYGIQDRSTVVLWLREYGTLEWSNPKKSSYAFALLHRKESLAQTIKRLEKSFLMNVKKMRYSIRCSITMSLMY